MMSEKNQKKDDGRSKEKGRILFVLISCAVLAVGITYVLYAFTQNLLKENLQERIIAIASTAATQILSDDLARIESPDDLSDPVAKKLAQQLSDIRDANENVRYVYLLRKTDDPDVLSFIMDAETLDTEAEQEAKAGGELAEDELSPQPGDPLEIEEYPALREEAFHYATSEKELQQDHWSTQLSAYAPVFDENHRVVAILGIDVIVNDYLARVQATLLPFLLFIFFLIFLLILLSLLLIRYSSERVVMLQEIDRQKDELLSIIAHQLLTPITAVKWTTENLMSGDMGTLSDMQKEEVTTIQSVSTQLSELVHMLLDVSRTQLGKIPINNVCVDLKKLFQEIVNLIAIKANEKKVTLKTHIPSALPTALLDERYTRMTIENLLSNAVKYTPEGGTVDFCIEVKNNVLRCSVRDTGYGIPLSEQPKIFEKLYRASNVRSIEGNGFGLYIAKGAIEAQGGKIWFESKEGKGTTFFVELPLKCETK